MKRIKKAILNTYVRVLQIIPGIRRKTVVFVSFNGKSYSDNPRMVSEALHKLMPEVRIVWMFKDPQSKKEIVPSYVECVGMDSAVRICGLLATAGVVVTNFTLYDQPKNKKQLYIQTWHGDKAFKKVLYDSTFVGEKFGIPEEKPGYCDYAIAGSEYGKMQYRSAFHYEGEVLMKGTPRNDKLIYPDPALQRQIRQVLNIPDEKQILLYAPTLRREQQISRQAQNIQSLDLSATLTALEKKTGKEWLCMLRAHPSITSLCGAGEDPRILDVSSYEDMADLLLIADMLITDYSSCAGDFALRGKPVVLYQADREEYLEKDRTFYFDIEQSPYMVAESQQELEKIINELTEEFAVQNCKEILEFYGDCESGHASEEVAKIISDWIKK